MGNLGTVLDKLSSLFSKYFLIGSYFPVLIFLSANGAYFYATSPIFRKWFERDAVQQGMAGVALLAAAAVLAYLLSTMSVALRQWLESPPMLPENLRKGLSDAQAEKRAGLNAKLEDHRSRLREFRKSQATWNKLLVDARKEGKKLMNSNSYFTTPKEVEDLVERVHRRERPEDEKIEKAVNALAAELKKYNVDEKDASTQARSVGAAKLDADEVRLRGAIDQLPSFIDREAVRIYNEIQFNFARTGATAPTRMGNIALSVQSYFGSRYNLNFNFFWTRIQKTLGGEDKYFPVLEGAKAQLEFHVALFWLSCAFGLVWTPASAWSGFSIWLLLFAAIGAPLAAWISYELAVQSYRSYADLLRTTVDLYHFKLMESLHFGLPASSNDEREIWKEVGQWLDQGDYLDVPYKHPAAS